MKSKVLLIANYPGDKQISMQRYAELLKDSLINLNYQVKLIYPLTFFGKFALLPNLKKWLFYFDKYFITFFYFAIFNKFYAFDIIHICDHSNSIYRPIFKNRKLVITCHDVLAIKGALGFKSAYCTASKMGKVLQTWILYNLQKFSNIIFVSEATYKDLQSIIPFNQTEKSNWKIIHHTLNQNFVGLKEESLNEVLAKFGLEHKKYLLHIGSDLTRKNRSILLDILELDATFPLVVSKPFTNQGIGKNFSKEKVIVLENLSPSELNAVYQGAFCLLFPSLAEGFGWPIIEAQKNGIPVLCSDIKVHKEIGGEGAIYIEPNDVAGFVSAINYIKNKVLYESWVLKGQENLVRYSEFKFLKSLKDYYANL